MVESNDRFWSKVQRAADDGCWEWTACRFSVGYGAFWFEGRLQNAHRVSWVLTHGPISGGLFVLHRCDNRPCVRPDHLFLGTQGDNIRDCRDKGRKPKTGVKLSPEQIAEVRRRYDLGESQPALGREFGVSPRTISRKVDGRGKGWRR